MNRTLTIIIGILFLFALGGFAFFFTPNEQQGEDTLQLEAGVAR